MILDNEISNVSSILVKKAVTNEVGLEATRCRPESTVLKRQHRYPSFLDRGHTMLYAAVLATPHSNRPSEQEHIDKANS